MRKDLIKRVREAALSGDATLITKAKKIVTNKERGSTYIGITLNNHEKWQVTFKYQLQNFYLCSLENLHQAALIHDICRIQHKGLASKTNFNFDCFEVYSILLLPNFITECKRG